MKYDQNAKYISVIIAFQNKQKEKNAKLIGDYFRKSKVPNAPISIALANLNKDNEDKIKKLNELIKDINTSVNHVQTYIDLAKEKENEVQSDMKKLIRYDNYTSILRIYLEKFNKVFNDLTEIRNEFNRLKDDLIKNKFNITYKLLQNIRSKYSSFLIKRRKLANTINEKQSNSTLYKSIDKYKILKQSIIAKLNAAKLNAAKAAKVIAITNAIANSQQKSKTLETPLKNHNKGDKIAISTAATTNSKKISPETSETLNTTNTTKETLPEEPGSNTSDILDGLTPKEGLKLQNTSISQKSSEILGLSDKEKKETEKIDISNALIMSKKIKNVFYVVLPIVGSMYYLFNFNSNQNVLDYYLRATESNRAFGILNDAIYISNFINKNLWVSLLLLTILICIFIFLFRNEHSKNVSDTHFSFITMFLGISSFINYDYRAIFLILIIDFLIQKNNRKILATSIVFTYSSPTLLHGYEKYYYLVQNDQFFYFDYSFYLLTALLILYIWKYIFSNSKINFR